MMQYSKSKWCLTFITFPSAYRQNTSRHVVFNSMCIWLLTAPLLAVWPWTDELFSLCLSFLTHQMGVKIVPQGGAMRIKWINKCKALRKGRCIIRAQFRLFYSKVSTGLVRGLDHISCRYSQHQLSTGFLTLFLDLREHFWINVSVVT